MVSIVSKAYLCEPAYLLRAKHAYEAQELTSYGSPVLFGHKLDLVVAQLKPYSFAMKLTVHELDLVVYL